jgi:hypothetical protein
MPGKKPPQFSPELEAKLRALRAAQGTLSSGMNTKKKAKPVGYKMQNTFDRSLEGVPGGSMRRSVTAAVVKMIAAPETGCRTRKESIGVLASARNANTTQGSYNRTVVVEPSVVHDHKPTWGCCANVVSDAQGRKVFGR